jgi:hypothetical protein
VGIAFLLLLGALAVGANAHNLATRTFPVYETAGLIIILIVVVGCIALTIPSLYRLKPGAIRLMIDDLGFDLVYEDGKVVRENWSDPTINFQLYDFSETSPGALRTPGLPYSIVVRGVTTVLSNDAYSAIVAHSELHSLVDSTAFGSRWIYPTGNSPTIHRMRSSGQNP